MRMFTVSVLLMLCLPTFGQDSSLTRTPIQTVGKIFRDYVKYAESTESESNRDSMTKALKSLQQSSRGTDLPILIDVWMYYDPTDFPTRELIQPIFNKNKSAALTAVNKRLHKKKGWEDTETAPYSDLIALKEQLSKQNR